MGAGEEMGAVSERVTVTLADRVAHVRLNRPEKLNALDEAMLRALVDAGAVVEADPGARVVVLSGAGAAFSVGLDFDSFRAMATGSGSDGRPGGLASLGPIADTGGRPTNLAQQAAYVWREMAKPVIASVHGHALGGGLQLALAADVRVAAPDANLGLLEIRWGLVPDMTGSVTLPELVPMDVVRELTFTGRTVSGTEAKELGLVTRVSLDPLAEAMALAVEIAGRNPEAVRAAKWLLDGAAGRDPVAQLARERTAQDGLIGSANQREAVTAHFEGRPPVFGD